MNGDDAWIEKRFDKLEKCIIDGMKEQRDSTRDYAVENGIAHKELNDILREQPQACTKKFLDKSTFWGLTKILIVVFIGYAGAIGAVWAFALKMHGG